MKLESLRIQNFRAIDDETINFDDYTCLVGANGCGKSTILCALNIFFRETAGSHLDLINLDKEDFHNGNTSEPIIVTATFTDLPKEAQEVDFADYYRQGKLVITAIAELTPESDAAEVKHYGQRTGMEEFRRFFEADSEGKPVAELRQIYLELMESFPELPKETVKQRMIDALHSYEESNPELCGLILSQDEFYGFSRGTNRLAKYIQWVFVPAVKDASNEQTEARDSALGKLLARTVRARINFQDPLKALREETSAKYKDLITQHQSELDELSASLQDKIIKWAHPDASIKLEWQHDPNKTVRLDEPFAQIIAGEGPFTGNMARLGHGLQRSYLIALLQELSMSNVETAPTLLLGCEEPELYQHPPQIRHLANLLQNLSKQNSQIIITTHSPYFVSGLTFENVRLARKEISTSKARFYQITFEDIDELIREVEGEKIARPMGVLAKIHQSLQPSLNEMFYSPKLVFVEGLEDVAYITTYLNLMNSYDETRRLGIHIVPTHSKSSMILPLCVARKFSIPTYIVFDSDGHLDDKNGSKRKHEKDNTTLLRLAGIENPDPFPNDNFWGGNVTMWKSNIGKEIKSDFDSQDWERYSDQIRNKYAKEKDLNKNYLFIADTLEMAWNDNKKSDNLQKLCIEILEFAKK